KVYGSADPSPLTTGTLSGFLASDNVTASYSRTAGETVAGSPYTISATLSPSTVLGNYNITYNTAKFTITALPLAPSFTASNQVYDGTTTATIVTRTLTRTIIGTDVVSLSGGTATFASANVGTWTVTGSGFTLAGAATANYYLSPTTATTTASITPAPLTMTANNASRPYGQPNPTFTATYSAFVNGETAGVLS